MKLRRLSHSEICRNSISGSNCDVDMFHAIKDELGEEVDYVWHDTENLDEYDAILLPVDFLMVTTYAAVLSLALLMQ